MVKGFWDKLKKPVMVLAPLANVTDAAFRRLIAKYSKPAGPDIFWTEFVSADGLVSKGREVLLKDLMYTPAERPIVAQLFGARPETMREAATLVQDLGFDGLDINMGCPDASVEKQGAGAALIKNQKLAQEIIAAAAEGAPNLPISIKTRLGYNRDELEEWLPVLLETGVAAVTIHARTRKEMSKVPACWERVRRAVEIRNEKGSEALILGNGDVRDLAHAHSLVAETGADGVMLGRAIFGNPWLFSETENSPEKSRGVEEKLKVLVEHTKLFHELLGDIKSFSIMKKHYKAYVNGFAGAAELREKLMNTESAKQVEEVVDKYLSSMIQ